MAFSATNRTGQIYYLHRSVRRLRNGRELPIYYISRAVEAALDQVPDGYEVHQSSTADPPLIRKRRPQVPPTAPPPAAPG